MLINMNIEKYKHVAWSDKPNKRLMPINFFTPEQRDEFNEVYKYIKDNYRYVEKTESGSMPYNHKVKYLHRYIINKSTTRFEIVLVCDLGCYRFQFGCLPGETNTISGRKALQEIYKASELFNIDFSKYAVEPLEGEEIKKTIDRPQIDDYCLKGKEYAEFDNVHHLDLNSSYASRICEVYPELKPMYEYLYKHRKDNNDYYKHVLTNSIGCMQSEYCVDYRDRKSSSPYQFATLAKRAIDNTASLIRDYVLKLVLSGRKVLLTNTDGIWYQGEIFHDEYEGTELGQWKNDHTNCKLLVKSVGAYQYIEDGVCHTVVRGETNLDAYKDREEWEYGDILRTDLYVRRWEFDINKGVKENVEGL